MSNRVITIKRAGTVNNVMYKDVLVGCFEDGDTEKLAIIIDGAIDMYVARQPTEAATISVIRETCEKVADVAYAMGQNGHDKNILKRFISETCSL